MEGQKDVRNPNHHYFSKVLQYTSNLYCNTPLICIAVLSVPLSSQEREILQYASHLYRSTPPICIAVRLPFVPQHACHLYRNTFGQILVVVVTGMFPEGGTSLLRCFHQSSTGPDAEFACFLQRFLTGLDKFP